jgi:hypothetical protein
MGDAMTLKDDVRTVVVDRLKDVDQTLIDAVMLSVDDVAATTQAQGRVRWESWSGGPVNGVPEDIVRERYPGLDWAFIVYVDEIPVYFQPHSTDGGIAPLTEEGVQNLATQFVANVVYQLAATALVNQVTTAVWNLQGEAAQRVVVPPAVVTPAPGARRSQSDTRGNQAIRGAVRWG